MSKIDPRKSITYIKALKRKDEALNELSKVSRALELKAKKRWSGKFFKIEQAHLNEYFILGFMDSGGTITKIKEYGKDLSVEDRYYSIEVNRYKIEASELLWNDTWIPSNRKEWNDLIIRFMEWLNFGSPNS